jgi:hypothetical protein
MPALYDRQPSRPSPEALSILTVSHPPRAALGPAPGHTSLRTLSQSAAGTAGRNGGQGPGGLHYRACCQGAHQRGLTTETGGSIPRTWALINSKPTSGSISFCCSQGAMNGPTLVGVIIPRFAHIVKRSYSPPFTHRRPVSHDIYRTRAKKDTGEFLRMGYTGNSSSVRWSSLEGTEPCLRMPLVLGAPLNRFAPQSKLDSRARVCYNWVQTKGPSSSKEPNSPCTSACIGRRHRSKCSLRL